MIRKTPAGDAAELVWFKSGYSSGTDGNSCVEIAITPEPPDAANRGQGAPAQRGACQTLTPKSWAMPTRPDA
ncbi:DUF397 domain-containing protein [Streptomyces sp. NPDC005799]|uniref:DUF397 domain-containing protein n=1 Tax=Streptomyces sp. NPDC005799 TaxID=3154678 RepID=UPI0033C176C1